jgi:hypothetical protein
VRGLRKKVKPTGGMGLKRQPTGIHITVGVDSARSIYKTMTAGGRGFSEYYIQRSSEKARLEANEILDNLRSGLSAAFDL